jgi:hypothetical protein
VGSFLVTWSSSRGTYVRTFYTDRETRPCWLRPGHTSNGPFSPYPAHPQAREGRVKQVLPHSGCRAS